MSKSRTGFFEMCRSIGLALIAKGQALPMALIVVLLVAVCKLPTNEIKQVLLEVITGFEHHHLLGWTLSLLLGFGWVLTNRWQRKVHVGEMDRISNEKSKGQKDRLNKNLSSTKNKVNSKK